jgi:hypothetical protein
MYSCPENNDCNTHILVLLVHVINEDIEEMILTLGKRD